MPLATTFDASLPEWLIDDLGVLASAAESDAVGALMQRGEWPAALRDSWQLAGDLA